MPEQFFEGTTLAGRVLCLFYEHTAYDTFVDEAGETVRNPVATEVTGTLDGTPIDIQALNWSGGSATVVSGQGTFTATGTDYAEDHSEALRRYLEHRPSDGWQVDIIDKAAEGDEWRYTVTITNGRLTERAEFRLSQQVMRTLARGGELPASDEIVARELTHTVRSDKWADIKRRAEQPTTLLFLAHPS